jgi:hypothetical protein
MKTVRIAALIVMLGPSASNPPSFCLSPPYVFFTISVSSAPGSELAFVDDGTVRLTAGHETRSAKLSPEDGSALSALLSRSNLAAELISYQSPPGRENPVGNGHIILSKDLDKWDVPGAAVASLSQRVLDLVDFADGIVRKYFGDPPSTRGKG